MQFGEEVIPDFELAPRECSSLSPQDDVSDEYFSDIFHSDMDEDDVSEHESPTRPKWEEKTIEVPGVLACNPLDPRKTRSQFHTAFSTSEVVIAKKCFMMVGYYPLSHQESSLYPIWKTTMQ